MCGILGYVGDQSAVPLLIKGLRRLEYRGYDSAGVATMNGRGAMIEKSKGRIDNLAEKIANVEMPGTMGISHTRWATHGGVTDVNAHPHTDQSGRLILVHNGVIENFRSLQEDLQEEGHAFKSETDTEVLAHLIGKEYEGLKEQGGDPTKELMLKALRKSLPQVSGTYGIVLMHEDLPGVLFGARRGSPLVIGVGTDENFIGSDVSPMVAHTQRAVYLSDFDLAVVEKETFEVQSLREDGSTTYEISEVEFSDEDVQKGDFPHYMLKEIFEQPEAVQNVLRGRLDRESASAILGGLNMSPRELLEVDRIVFTGCGTALHAGMVGEYMVEALAHIPSEVEFASEFRYRNIPITRNTLVMAISQSGETADTLAAMRETQRRGYRTLGIVNTVGSTIARESDGGVYMYAGPEIGVAATKSFTSQVLVCLLLAFRLGRMRYMNSDDGHRLIDALEALPDQISQILKLNDQIKEIALKYAECEGMLYMGRQLNYPIALEGALKIKEIAYLYASGHPSAELKHGYIALVNPETPSVFIAPDDSIFDKNISNIQEVKARDGKVVAIGTEGNTELEKTADDVILVPKCHTLLSPILANIPLQLLAYHIAVERGCDVDKPRNLAKSVTVE